MKTLQADFLDKRRSFKLLSRHSNYMVSGGCEIEGGQRLVDMRGSPWHFRVVVRYALFQIPGILMALLGSWLAVTWMELPLWIAVAFVCAWVVKDMVLFRFVWRSYDDRVRPGDPFSMIGLQGIAQERLAPSGYVLVRGERWKGDVIGRHRSVEKGEIIMIRGVKGLTLLVEPATIEGLEKKL